MHCVSWKNTKMGCDEFDDMCSPFSRPFISMLQNVCIVKFSTAFGRGRGLPDPEAGVREPGAQPAVRARRHRALLHDLTEPRLRGRRRHHPRRLEVSHTYFCLNLPLLGAFERHIRTKYIYLCICTIMCILKAGIVGYDNDIDTI